MVDVVPTVRVLYPINKDEGDEFLPLLAFQRDNANEIFLKYLKKGRSSLRRSIRSVPLDFCYDDLEHCQVPSEKQDRCTKRTPDASAQNVK